MSYQVLARKWRPQQFDDVIGQPAVTRTLKNAIASGRMAQAFVFAGPRGVGKTTTARILARALSCDRGPTANPCGECDPCREIAEGRDIDVLEIDAATHTQVDNVREVIIAGLAFMPARNRCKIFIIDEVHQLSAHSFNALLKSIEEPPPHVIFMMATTELSKIPETVLSRSQVFEFRTISSRQIADQLRKIANAEKIDVSDAALLLIARAADGSMRDAQSAFDQVIAFAGQSISPDDVATVLGLVGRDLVLDMVTAVAEETPAAAFELTGRAVELGYDLRLVVRELSRVVRDLLVVSVDPSRLQDPEIAPEVERDRLKGLAARFSREDLLRAFDVLSKADVDLRGAVHPRYHLEMALLRWIHLRKLVPLTELLAGMGATGSVVRPPAAGRTPEPPAPLAQKAQASAAGREPVAPKPVSAQPGEGGRDAFLTEIRRTKPFFYNTVVAQALKIEFGPDRATFSFLPAHRTLREQLEQNRPWLESIAASVSGKPMPVGTAQAEAIGEAAAVSVGASAPFDSSTGSGSSRATSRDDKAQVAPSDNRGARKPTDLKSTAMADTTVQAMLDVFPAEIEDVEEI
jgi:DNA polymerase III subunit gamma/tau